MVIDFYATPQHNTSTEGSSMGSERNISISRIMQNNSQLSNFSEGNTRDSSGQAKTVLSIKPI